jgi:hypothetical protein
MPVIWLIIDDDVSAILLERFYVVGAIIYIEVGVEGRFCSYKAKITIGNLSPIQPISCISGSDRMAPVDVQSVANDPDPNPLIRKSPESFCSTFNHWHIAKHSVLYYSSLMEALEVIWT